jgi:hypothetical protein
VIGSSAIASRPSRSYRFALESVSESPVLASASAVLRVQRVFCGFSIALALSLYAGLLRFDNEPSKPIIGYEEVPLKLLATAFLV